MQIYPGVRCHSQTLCLELLFFSSHSVCVSPSPLCLSVCLSLLHTQHTHTHTGWRYHSVPVKSMWSRLHVFDGSMEIRDPRREASLVEGRRNGRRSPRQKGNPNLKRMGGDGRDGGGFLLLHWLQIMCTTKHHQQTTQVVFFAGPEPPQLVGRACCHGDHRFWRRIVTLIHEDDPCVPSRRR